jgi:lipopolysaccharide transport system ATP-binding protein
MYMRLAFAVASHLEPEIMVIDEVLAVGDVSFQKKCLGKMGDVAQEGRTVLFVSHNMVAIQSLCKRALWLNHGQIVEDGKASAVVSNYLNNAFGSDYCAEEAWSDVHTAPGNEAVRLRRISIRPESDDPAEPLTTSTPFLIEVEYWNLVPDAKLHITLHIFTENEVLAFTTGSGAGERVWSGRPMPTGAFRSLCHMPANLLNVGRHRFNVLVIKDSTSILFQYESEVTFEVLDLDEREISQYGREPGVVRPALKWSTEKIETE